ncbi:MAG TPA: uroporphyrinogen-III synthase [Candidatus Saccharimonadales bacterium]|nr:uroporphyrinogen-III synthase [Candidatus Saccharimonadales bacterium]
MKKSDRFVVVTRPESESKEFIQKLEKANFHVLSYPTVSIVKNRLSKSAILYLKNLSSFDWIFFTSKSGVNFFFDSIKKLGIDKSILKKIQIAVIGPATAREIIKHKLSVSFMPSKFTTDDLAREIKNIKNKKILLPRSDIATPLLTRSLKQKGANVINIPIYKTKYAVNKNIEFSNFLQKKQILALTFTSPSTVNGFVKNITSYEKKNAIHIPVFSIGPITSKAVKKQGFKIIHTAHFSTHEGILAKLQEINL